MIPARSGVSPAEHQLLLAARRQTPRTRIPLTENTTGSSPRTKVNTIPTIVENIAGRPPLAFANASVGRRVLAASGNTIPRTHVASRCVPPKALTAQLPRLDLELPLSTWEHREKPAAACAGLPTGHEH